MIRTFDIFAGVPVPDVSILDGPAALARKRLVERRLGELRGQETPEREALKAENAALDARLRDHRDEVKRQNARRNFAGLGSPLHEVLVERLEPATVHELETAALTKLEERERRAVERKAKGGA